MSLAVWFSLLTASVVISFTPGAGAINTMSNALSQGWRRSIWGIIGQQLALVVHVVVVAAGVGLLVSRSELLFNGIRYAGAAYLVYLGLRLILAKPTAPVADDAGRAADRGGDQPEVDHDEAQVLAGEAGFDQHPLALALRHLDRAHRRAQTRQGRAVTSMACFGAFGRRLGHGYQSCQVRSAH